MHEHIKEYIELLNSPGHWMFEITLMLIFDILIGIIIWPVIKHLLEDHNYFHSISRRKKHYKVKKK